MQEQLSSTTTARDLGVKIQLTDPICGLSHTSGPNGKKIAGLSAPLFFVNLLKNLTFPRIASKT